MFSGLKDHQYSVESRKTPEYNCIAWAAGDNSRPWWPMPWENDPPYYWPEVSDDESLSTFISGFQKIGYEVCDNGNLEPGYEKIAFYEQDGEISHAARQEANGMWTSKCGDLQDILHESLNALTGERYGQVVCFMSRKWRG
ncbi:MAG: hypothetical protein HC910_07790 [Spirulinaceae cyanobacterium SM2_1_0]|nr:hypothetical protein [Spirulinaceae cyanobacterium SM2_1_0]